MIPAPIHPDIYSKALGVAEAAHKAHRPRVGDQVDATLEEAATRDPWAGSELRTLTGWRYDSGPGASRNLSPAKQRKVFQRSDAYYETNPTYQHCVNLKTQSIVGDGFRLEAENDPLAATVRDAVIVFVVCDRGDRYLSTGVFPA